MNGSAILRVVKCIFIPLLFFSVFYWPAIKIVWYYNYLKMLTIFIHFCLINEIIYYLIVHVTLMQGVEQNIGLTQSCQFCLLVRPGLSSPIRKLRLTRYWYIFQGPINLRLYLLNKETQPSPVIIFFFFLEANYNDKQITWWCQNIDL